MEKTTKVFLTLYSFVRSGDRWISQSSEHEVENEEEGYKRALYAKLCNNCYGYSLKTRKYIEIDGEIYESKEIKNHKTVIFGKVYTLKEIKRMEDCYWLVKIMETNHYKKAVKITTRYGDWIRWDENVEYVSE